MTDPLGGVTAYDYDEVDRLIGRRLPNGVVSTYAYDDRDRVLSVTHTGASGVLASVTYVRNASGEPTKITREDGSYVDLTYDAALRLDTETYYNASGGLLDAIDYDYDDDGNRTRKTSLTGGVEDYHYSPGFRLDSVTKSGSTDTFGYDGGGRVTSIARDGATQVLTYNSDDKVTRVAGGSTDVQYTYDGVGRRVAKVEGGSTTRYLVAPNLGDGFETPQAVTDASGNVLASYVFAGEHPLMKIEGGVATYYLQDAMGSVVGMANAAGASAGSIKYDGFGNVTSAVGAATAINPTVGWDFRMQGMALDQATGLYHVRARTYDARTGRFTTRDPIDGQVRSPETYPPYSFALQNADSWRDPSGLQSLLESSPLHETEVGTATYAYSLLLLARSRYFRPQEVTYFEGLFGNTLSLGSLKVAALQPKVTQAIPNLLGQVNLTEGASVIELRADFFEDAGNYESPITSQGLFNGRIVAAHELFHLWQLKYWDPSALRQGLDLEGTMTPGAQSYYDKSVVEPSLVLDMFIHARPEQQARMFTDYVAMDNQKFSLVSEYVKNPRYFFDDIPVIIHGF